MNNTSVLLLILGIYSGLLSTLPIGPYKLLCIRHFLINTKNNYNLIIDRELASSSFIAGVSGLIMAQIFIIVSIYNSYLYSLWMRPHLISLISLPILFFYWNRIKTLDLDIFSESSEKSYLHNFRIQTAFLETFFLQLLNPISFPNGVFSRLPSLFLFRYSNIAIFLFGLILGFISGYIIFFLGSIYLVKRLENDTPTIYRLVKRVIHQSTVSIFFIICLISLGRTPIPSIKSFSFYQKPWQDRPWPGIFFSYNTWTRPLRLLKNNQNNLRDENLRAFNKMYFSEFFFETCKNNDKNKLIHNYPENIALISNEFENILDRSEQSSNVSNQINTEWIEYKKNRLNDIKQNIEYRLLSLQEKPILETLIDRKIGSLNKYNHIVKKIYDPRLNESIIGKKQDYFNKSPLLRSNEDLLTNNSYLTTEETNIIKINTKNKLKLFLSKNFTNNSNIPIILWKNFSENKQQNSKELDFIQEDNFTIEDIEELKDRNIISWNNIFSLIKSALRKSKEDEINNKEELDESILNINSNETKFINLYKKLPSWDPQIKTTDLETPEPYESRSVLANFVRHLLPGSIRARRRKALAWKTYQNRPHAPIFLRGIDSLNLEKNLITFRNTKLLYLKSKDVDIEQSPNILKSRWDFQLAHFFRGIALCGQGYIRRYIRLPILIICKNLSRRLLAQKPEWEEDWQDLSQEIYLDCDYDGNDLSVGLKFPKLADTSTGKQIKILRPFRLIYSQVSSSPSLEKEDKILRKSSSFDSENTSNYTLDNYSYLTIWGDETTEPFGQIKPQPYFWRLIFQRIKLIIRYKFINKIVNLFDKLNWVNNILKQMCEIISYGQQNIFNLFAEKPNENTERNSSINSLIEDKNLKTNEFQKKNKIKVLKNVTKAKQEEFFTEVYNIKQLQNNNKKVVLDYSKNRGKNFQSNYFKIKNQRNLHRNIENRTNRIYKYSLQHIYIYIQKYLFDVKKGISKNIHKILWYQNKIQNNIKIYVLKKQKQIVRWIIQCISQIRKYTINMIISLSKILKLSIFELFHFNSRTKNENIINLNTKALNSEYLHENKKISEAYILHSMWQDFIINNYAMNNILKDWNSNTILKTDIEVKLNRQGILTCKNPEDLEYISFQEWLKKLPSYQPSFKVWQHIVPQYWQKEVEEQWQKSPNSILVSKEYKSHYNYGLYHKPLFEKLQKFSQISQINVLIKKYTNFIETSNEHFNNIVDTKDVKKISKQKSDNRFTQDLNRNVLSIEGDNQYSRFDTIKTSLLKKIPIINKKLMYTKGDISIFQIKNRITYPPIHKNKWKFNNLKNRFRNLMKIAKQRMVIKESLFYKKQKIDIPSSMRKDLNIFYESFEPEDVLFLNVLENWRYKILDDELLTHNMISSYLRFINKEKHCLNRKNNWNEKISQQDVINTYYILPENFLLPENIYQLRILEKLNNEAEKNNKRIIGEYNNNSQKEDINMNNNGSIMRFLWPSHRIEDLAYMNRYWLATSNQSKFGLLRIRTFPID